MGSSVASGESGVTGTTMQSALDRYLMGEAESDVTSADDSDVSGSYMGGDEGQWRMGGSETEDETIDLGAGSAESGGEGRETLAAARLEWERRGRARVTGKGSGRGNRRRPCHPTREDALLSAARGTPRAVSAMQRVSLHRSPRQPCE